MKNNQINSKFYFMGEAEASIRRLAKPQVTPIAHHNHQLSKRKHYI